MSIIKRHSEEKTIAVVKHTIPDSIVALVKFLTNGFSVSLLRIYVIDKRNNLVAEICSHEIGTLHLFSTSPLSVLIR